MIFHAHKTCAEKETRQTVQLQKREGSNCSPISYKNVSIFKNFSKNFRDVTFLSIIVASHLFTQSVSAKTSKSVANAEKANLFETT